MAKRRPYTTNPTSGAQEWLPTTDTLEASLNVSGPAILGRKTTGEGGHEELTPAALAEHTTPVSGDFLVAFAAGSNEPKKVNVGNLPGGGGDSLGTGFTSGGGSGTIPDGTVADVGDGQFEIKSSTLYQMVIGLNKAKFGPGALSDSDGSVYIGPIGSGTGITYSGNGEALIMYGDNGSGTNQMLYVSNYRSILKGFVQDGNAPASELEIGTDEVGILFTDHRATPYGAAYAADYSANIAANDRIIPDVGTTKKITQRLAFLASC